MTLRVLLILLLTLAVGCGGSQSPGPATPAPEDPSLSAPPLDTAPVTPAEHKPASAREALDAFEAAIKAQDRDAAMALTAGGLLRVVVEDLISDRASGFTSDAPSEHPENGTCFPTEVQYPGKSRSMTFCVKQGGSGWHIETITVRATAEPAPSPAQTTPPPPPAQVEQSVEGKIVSRAKDKVTIQIDGTAPAAGSKAELYRKLEHAILFIPAGAWIGIADVTVDKVDGHKVTLTINERKSTVTINGVQVDHFKPQTAIRLTWTASP
jgi:hypothetical protein